MNGSGLSELDVPLTDGRVLRAYDTGTDSDSAGLAILWHHGSPQTGAPLEPVRAAAAHRGIRLLSYGRPSYGGSSPHPGRTVGSAAADVAAVLDACGVDRVAMVGASGGGSHALACAALLPDRVVAAVSLAGPAPYTDDVDWYAGMVAPGGLRAGAEGREARRHYAETDTFDEKSFIAADYAALDGPWAALGADVGRANEAGPDGLIDDDVALAHPWGVDITAITAPVLLVHGGLDRVIPVAHSQWLLRQCPNAELWLRPRDGHISILDAIPVTLDWLRARA